MLRRLEDLDWFLRFAQARGRLATWPNTAAMIELGPRPDPAVVENTTRQIAAKYASADSPHQLPASHIRRLKAYLDVERASAFAARRRWVPTVYYMVRSLARVPRTSLHLEQFWDAS